jgi:glycosyltransferase involved in cell wall biosynthesis
VQSSLSVIPTVNIVLVNDFAHINGGASKVALGSARALAVRGHRVVVMAGVGPVDASLTNVDNLSVECLGQHDLLGNPNRLSAAVQGIWNWDAAARIKAILSELPLEDTVVHVHMWGKALTSSVVRTAAEMGFPIILTLHDFLAACPTGTLFHHRSQSICTLDPMSLRCIASVCDARNYGHKLWRVGRQLAQLGPGKLPSGIGDFIAISSKCKSVMEQHLAPGARLHLIENPVDVQRAPRVDVAANRHFGFVGRLAAEKGVVLFARAAKTAQVSALFIGEGEKRDAILQANPDAVVTGWKSGDEALELLRTARALVFPSLWQETQGLVVAEALAMGIPAIVADSSAATDWVTDGHNGLWFRSGDAQDLAAKICCLRDQPEEAARMGHRAYDTYWAEPATVKRHISALESLYLAVCSPTGAIA